MVKIPKLLKYTEKEVLLEAVKRNYILKEDNGTYITLLCNECGKEWKTRRSTFMTKYNCWCRRGYSKEEISIEAEKRNYNFKEKMGGSSILLCNKCGKEWKTITCTFMKGKCDCPCKTKYTEKEIKEEATKRNYILKEKNGTFITLLCNECGKEWKTTNSNFIKNKSNCSCKIEYTEDEIRLEAEKRNYILKEKNGTFITLLCNECGKEWKTSNYNFIIKKVNCRCYRYYSGTKDDISLDAKKRNYILKEKRGIYITLLCNECGKEWKTSYCKFIKKRYDCKCRNYYTEEKIRAEAKKRNYSLKKKQEAIQHYYAMNVGKNGEYLLVLSLQEKLIVCAEHNIR